MSMQSRYYIVPVQNWPFPDTEALEVTEFPVKLCHFEGFESLTQLSMTVIE